MTIDALRRTMLQLKELRRAGWARVGHPGAESVADHSWSVAMLALLHCPPELDREKLLIMALLHDLAEIVVGDITPHDGVSKADKHACEAAAMADLLAERPDLLAIWHEAEARQSPEALLLKRLDRTDMGLQAERYVQTGHISSEAAAEFSRSAGSLVDIPQGLQRA